MRSFPILLTAAGLIVAAHAQDTRTVTEPVIPPACATITAALSGTENGRTIAEADESKLDTARIQKALDACPAGNTTLEAAADK